MAIDAIGAASPDARRMILSGETVIDRKALRELKAKPIEEIGEVAAAIETKTYEKVKIPAQTPMLEETPIALLIAGLQSLSGSISEVLGRLSSEPSYTIEEGSKTELLEAIRAAMGGLEELIMRI